MKYFLLFILLKLNLFFSYGQDPYYIPIDKNNGLPQNSIYDIFQDSKGFIWVTTNEGLSRYDGYEFKTYSFTGQNSKSGSFIKEDKYGRIWYQTFDGAIFYVENDSLKALQHKKTALFTYYGILNDKLLAPGEKNVDIYDLGTLKIVKSIPLDNISNFSSSLQSESNYYLLGGYKDAYHGTLFKIDRNLHLTRREIINHPFQKAPSRVFKGKNEGILINMAYVKMRMCYEIKNDTIITKFPLPIINYIHFATYSDNIYWFCTPQGVFVFDETGTPLNNGKAYFPGKNISNVFKDKEGNFWFGTLTEGLLFVPDISSKVILNGIATYSMALRNNYLYTGSSKGEIYKTNLSNFFTQHIYSGFSNEGIYDLEYDTTWHKLVLANFGFRAINNAGKVHITVAGSVKDFEKVSTKYYAYAATGDCCLLKVCDKGYDIWDDIFKRHRVSYLNNPERASFLYGQRGKAVTFNRISNTIYFATNIGLFKLTPDSIYEIKYYNESLKISTLHAYENVVYAKSLDYKMLKIYTNDSIENLHHIEGLENASIRNTGLDKHFLFLMTPQKLLILDLQHKQEKLIDPSIYINEINDLVLWKDKLLIANSNYVLMKDFNSGIHIPAVSKFIINSITVNNQKVDITSTHQFSHTQNNIEIRYSILSFKTNSKFPLYYKINNGDWEPAPAESRILKLAALAPGTYSIAFKLGEVANNNYPTQTIHFTIAKPWWQQAWFITICSALVLAAAYAFYRTRTYRLEKQNKLLLDKNVLEQSLNKSILTSIKAQMNPHFFYNALNSIQSFVFSGDKKNATIYLSKFSKLTRTILEMSDKESVTLNEELTFLEIYLEIEKVRFNDNFDFTIHVADRIDAEFVHIPSMIIQPYVENAIKHGLLHKKNDRKLIIDVKEDVGNLMITIDDNGIGRKQSEEINKAKLRKHNSFATNANQKRLELLNKNRGINNKMVVKYIDKTGENNNPTGTTVMIYIPITQNFLQ